MAIDPIAAASNSDSTNSMIYDWSGTTTYPTTGWVRTTGTASGVPWPISSGASSTITISSPRPLTTLTQEGRDIVDDTIIDLFARKLAEKRRA